MRAILIDPFAKSVSEVECNGTLDGAQGIYSLVFGTHSPGDRHLVEAVDVGANHHAYIDEEGLLTDWHAQSFFALKSSRPFAGRALILSAADDGEEGPATIRLSAVSDAVRWVEPKDVRVPAPRLIADDGEETLLAGVDEWTIDNNPGRET